LASSVQTIQRAEYTRKLLTCARQVASPGNYAPAAPNTPPQWRAGIDSNGTFAGEGQTLIRPITIPSSVKAISTVEKIPKNMQSVNIICCIIPLLQKHQGNGPF
jgi:hypothetical protein